MKSSNKLDRLFWILFFIFSLLIGILLIRGDQTYPKVIASNLEQEVLPLSTNQIVLTFNRNMDRASVEEHFLIEPDMQGKFSWIGKKMAYSFTDGLEAGQSLKINLVNAADEQGVIMGEVYEANYTTADQHLYFVGVLESQSDRLVQYSFNSKKSEILSPENLIIKDFKVHPHQKLVYLFGRENGANQQREDLYQLNLETEAIEKIVDGKKEFIFSFDLSPDGKILLVRKGILNEFDQSSLVDPGRLWIFDIESQSWSEFWNKEIYGSEFFFSPDSNYLVGRLISGDITILPIQEDPDKVVYLQNYAGSYNLSPDGSKLVFVDFEDPFSPNNLLLRGTDGETKELVSGKGQIQFPIFNRAGDSIYFLLSQAGDDFEETGLLQINPYHLYRYDLEENKLLQLTTDEKFFEGFFHLSSDGKKIAFERYQTAESGAFFEGQLGEEAPGAELWIYDQASGELQNIELRGTKPYLN